MLFEVGGDNFVAYSIVSPTNIFVVKVFSFFVFVINYFDFITF